MSDYDDLDFERLGCERCGRAGFEFFLSTERDAGLLRCKRCGVLLLVSLSDEELASMEVEHRTTGGWWAIDGILVEEDPTAIPPGYRRRWPQRR